MSEIVDVYLVAVGKYHDIDESQFNLLKSKILARAEILIDEMPLDNGDAIDV